MRVKTVMKRLRRARFRVPLLTRMFDEMSEQELAKIMAYAVGTGKEGEK